MGMWCFFWVIIQQSVCSAQAPFNSSKYWQQNTPNCFSSAALLQKKPVILPPLLCGCCCSGLSHELIAKAGCEDEWKASVSAWWVLESRGQMKCEEQRPEPRGCRSAGALTLAEWWARGFSDLLCARASSCPLSDIRDYLSLVSVPGCLLPVSLWPPFVGKQQEPPVLY